MNTTIHYRNWIDADKQKLAKSKSFKDLADIVIEIINRIPKKIEMVSGPISTGGVGSKIENLKVFESVVEILILESKLNIFSQIPFEEKMNELYREWYVNNPDEKYCMPILEEFYERLFSSGKVKKLHFINDWQSSFGARWEHDNCDRWGIERNYLPRELSVRALNGSLVAK